MVDLKITLPAGFLDKEERCGYLVTSKMKEVWAVELDLLEEFKRVAAKYDIKYMANGGTMLGAARHQGFIPWDDDLDIMMMRQEYDRLCEVAPAEFTHPYFFQTEYTDPGSLRCHAQLRNSLTTAILDEERRGHMRFNQGIFIDIFPLDAVPDDPLVWEQECRRAQRLNDRMVTFATMSSHYAADPSAPHYEVKRLLHLLCAPLWQQLAHQYFVSYERECVRFNHEHTRQLSIYSWGYKYKKLHRSRALHEHTRLMKFEFTEIPVCYDYDAALTEVFGDWHRFVRGTSIHHGIFFDTDRPYTDYI